MGLQLPKRARRVTAWTAVSATLLLLAGCSSADVDQVRRLAMPVAASDRAEGIHSLWQGSWLAAMIVGLIVWGLILYAVFRYRRRSDDEIPVQVRYNLPIEILYTIAPIIIVLVLFFFTIRTQNDVLAEAYGEENPGEPDHTVLVIGQQWSWTFNYLEEEAVGGEDVYTVGTTQDFPTLVLPVNETVRFELESPDVIHSFWVPAFAFKLDVIPGRGNAFELTPTREGEFAGKCAELCGVYHARMLFNVEVVDREEYDDHLRDLQAAGNVGVLRGGADAEQPAGALTEDEAEEGRQDEVHEGEAE